MKPLRRAKAAFLHWLRHPGYDVLKHQDCPICYEKLRRWLAD